MMSSGDPFCLGDDLAGHGKNRDKGLLERHLDPPFPILAGRYELVDKFLELEENDQMP